MTLNSYKSVRFEAMHNSQCTMHN